MRKDTSKRINSLHERISRKKSKEEIEHRLELIGISPSFLSNERQNEIISLIRNQAGAGKEPYFKHLYENMEDGLVSIKEKLIDLMDGICIAIPYNIDKGSAFLIDKYKLIHAITTNPFIVSDDGLVVANSDATVVFIIDFYERKIESELEIAVWRCKLAKP